jgi:copper transport protein
MRSIQRRMMGVVAAFLAVLFTVVGTSSSVSAHAVLDSSSPAASTVLETSPSEIRLAFNEPVESSLLEIRLFGSDQKELQISDAVRLPANASVVTASVPQLDNGVYVVVWRVMSTDGHPATGAFPFEIGRTTSGAGQDLVAQIVNGLDRSSPLEIPLNIARFLAYFAVVVLAGGVALAWGSALMNSAPLRQLFSGAVAVFAAGAVAIVFLQGAYATGRSWDAVFDTDVLIDVLGTRLGVASLVRFAAIVAWGMLLLTLHRATTAVWQNSAVLVAAVSILTFSVSGHPSSGSYPWVFIAVDAVHFAAISMWVGGLIALFVARHEENINVQRFSRIATRALPVVVVTGALQAAHLMDGLSDLGSTTYGQLLVAKVVIVAVLAISGAAARQRIANNSVTPIVSILKFDALLVVAVLALTSVMTTTPPGSTVNPADQIFSATQIQADVLADITVVPARVGAAEVHVILTPPGGALAPVVEAIVQFSLPARNIPPIPVSMIELGPNHWTGIVQIPYSGDWEMKVQVEVTPGSIVNYTAVVSVTN